MLDKYVSPVRLPPIYLTSLPRFHKMLGSDELRAWYGPDHVALAIDRGAVGTLLISDELFRYVPAFIRLCDSRLICIHRSNDPVQRKRYVQMVEDVRAKGGEALIFSSMHESGQRKPSSFILHGGKC